MHLFLPCLCSGYFLRLHSRTTKDKSHVQTLEDIANDDTPAFLNLSDISSFPAGPRDTRDHSRLIYTIGNVFLVDDPIPATEGKQTGDNQACSASSGSSRHKSASSSDGSGRCSNGLMRCLDERGTAVIIPTNQVRDKSLKES